MKYKNILIIKMSALGDVMHAIPCADALRKLYPEAKITWIVHPQFGAFVPQPPIVDEIIYFDKAAFSKQTWTEKIRRMFALRRELKSKKFDLVIDLQGLLKSAVVAFLSGCSNRIGYNDMREGSGFISKAVHGPHDQGHVVQQYLDVIRYLGAQVEEPVFPMPALDSEKEKMRKLILEEKPAIDWQKTVVLVPGAGWVTKEWPESYFAELARKIAAQGNTVILAGGPAELAKADNIVKLLPEGLLVNLVGKTSLRELAALMGIVGVCIGGDTGPVHIAAAMGCRIIALFGPSSGHRAGPYGKLVRIISSTESCCPCFKRKCPINKNCMSAISVDEVYAAFQDNSAPAGR